MKRFNVRKYAGGYTLLLPGHKADRFFEGTLLQIFPSTAPYSLVLHLRHYLALWDCYFCWSPHLCLLADGSPPSQCWFIAQLHCFFPATISGHSLRAGGATTLAMVGVSDNCIWLRGCWSLDAFQIYLQKILLFGLLLYLFCNLLLSLLLSFPYLHL